MGNTGCEASLIARLPFGAHACAEFMIRTAMLDIHNQRLCRHTDHSQAVDASTMDCVPTGSPDSLPEGVPKVVPHPSTSFGRAAMGPAAPWKAGTVSAQHAAGLAQPDDGS